MGGEFTESHPHLSPPSSPLTTIGDGDCYIVDKNQQKNKNKISDPWKKLFVSNNTWCQPVMGTSSWPSLLHSTPSLPAAKDQTTNSDVIDGAKGLDHSNNHGIMSASEVSSPKILYSSSQDTGAVAENITLHSLESSSNGNGDFKVALSIVVENGSQSDRDRTDYSIHGSQSAAQQRYSNNLSKQKPRPNMNQTHYSSYQKTSTRNHQPRYYNSKNPNWRLNNAPPGKQHSNMPGYANFPAGFHGPPQPPPFAYPHFGSFNNHLHGNMPFSSFPLRAPPPIQYTSYFMPVGYGGNPYFSGGTTFIPQSSQPSNFQDQDAGLCHAIRHQIEYYFSDENLVNDNYLRNQMDAHGWVSVNLIANFNKVSRMTRDVNLIIRALRFSHSVEVKGNKIRKRGSWWSWILPKSSQIDAEENLVQRFRNIELESKHIRESQTN